MKTIIPQCGKSANNSINFKMRATDSQDKQLYYTLTHVQICFLVQSLGNWYADQFWSQIKACFCKTNEFLKCSELKKTRFQLLISGIDNPSLVWWQYLFQLSFSLSPSSTEKFSLKHWMLWWEFIKIAKTTEILVDVHYWFIISWLETLYKVVAVL